MVPQYDNRGGIQRQDFSERWQRLLLHERFNLFIDRGGMPNLFQFKFSIPEKSVHIPKTSINQRDMILTVVFPRSQPSWRQDPKGRQLLISKCRISRQASRYPVTQSPHQSRRSALMIWIFPCPQASSKAQCTEESFTSSSLSLFSRRLR